MNECGQTLYKCFTTNCTREGSVPHSRNNSFSRASGAKIIKTTPVLWPPFTQALQMEAVIVKISINEAQWARVKPEWRVLTHTHASELMCSPCKDLITPPNKSPMEPRVRDSISFWQLWLYLLSIQAKQFCLTNAITHPENSVFAWDPFVERPKKGGKCCGQINTKRELCRPLNH